MRLRDGRIGGPAERTYGGGEPVWGTGRVRPAVCAVSAWRRENSLEYAAGVAAAVAAAAAGGRPVRRRLERRRAHATRRGRARRARGADSAGAALMHERPRPRRGPGARAGAVEPLCGTPGALPAPPLSELSLACGWCRRFRRRTVSVRPGAPACSKGGVQAKRGRPRVPRVMMMYCGCGSSPCGAVLRACTEHQAEDLYIGAPGAGCGAFLCSELCLFLPFIVCLRCAQPPAPLCDPPMLVRQVAVAVVEQRACGASCGCSAMGT